MSILKKDPLQIIAFQSYGTNTQFYLRGRALEDESIDLEKRSWLSLLINTWKRLDTDEVRHVDLMIKLLDGTILETKTNAKGYFKIKAELKNLISLTNDGGWLTCEVAYSDVNIKRSIQNHNCFRYPVSLYGF